MARGVFSSVHEIVLEVRGGEGGADSKLFAQDLFSAYLKFARARRLGCEVLGSSDGQFSAKVVGQGAWDTFRSEAGKHCVQRVPPTEKKGRRQTSYVVVGVLPLPEEELPAISAADIEVKTQGGHGKGGQHQNKTDSAVRMRHRPTGLHVLINGRHQYANRKEALRILAAKVADYYRAQVDDEYGQIRKSQLGDAGRGDKIRTYNFIMCRAVDHRTGKKTSHVRRVIERGEFNLLR